jgi:hypothetical protein
MNAVAAVCLLNRIAFTEREYGAADHHVRALRKLTAERVWQLPGFCWVLLIWADLHLTGVQVRAPYLAYHVHPDFRYRPLNGKFQTDADTYFSEILPGGLAISSHFRDTATQLYQRLRELAYSYDVRDFEWNISRGMSYEIGYRLAETQVTVDKSGTLEERLILIGCQMHFWGMSKPFVPQSGIQSFQMHRLSQLIATMQPGTLFTRWLEHTGSLDLLLWCLCNAAGAALHQLQDGTSSPSTHRLPAWLQHHVTYIIALLGIVDPEDLEARLQRLPFSEDWNRAACQSFFSETHTLDALTMSKRSMSETNVGLFRDLRLIFDPCVHRVKQQEQPRPILVS